MGLALRILVLAAWVAAVWVVLLELQSAGAWLSLLVGTVVVGALVGRWWALLAPVALAVVWTIAGTLAPDGSDDWNFASYATVGAIAAVVFALAMAIGVGVHQLIARRPATPGAARR
ncbi:hypothetical protein DVA67_008360 [Solirubrobacter sp. CPCC 204708]|uniref:Uncharacterized protein n=1 Tax=Solirubrobacter deserti TaxID=2282478 RepID=A0ABT4REJ0_9ACTN|nr:hypothetical protein [Solirubrobacter deserti]MBE2315984.1 hypothetical protein [Solirubrobacter deserti]MDA0136735.1 hypothetical protein [Solirubrobacter deserti]